LIFISSDVFENQKRSTKKLCNTFAQTKTSVKVRKIIRADRRRTLFIRDRFNGRTQMSDDVSVAKPNIGEPSAVGPDFHNSCAL
jgi:hypothetical protein